VLNPKAPDYPRESILCNVAKMTTGARDHGEL